MKNIQKRYIILIFVIVIVVVIIWKMYPSFAHMEQGYEGNNIITGRNWGINITEVSNVVKKGNAILRTNIDSIATTFNFKAELQEPGDEISFDIKVTNTGKLNAELYAIANSGVPDTADEVIDYEVLPLDYETLHTDKQDGSIIKPNESQLFTVTIKYNNNIGQGVKRSYDLSLGSTIIYKQK